MRHFTETEITDYFSGKLPAAELLWFDDHLRKCEECAASMSSMVNENSDELADLFHEPVTDIHLDYDQLAAYADGEIDDVGREIVDVHTKACDFCADQLNEILALREQLNRNESSSSDKEQPYSPGIFTFLFRIAAPAFGLVLIGVIVWFFWPSRSTDQQDIAAAVADASPPESSPAPASIGNEATTNSENLEKGPAVVKLADGNSTIELFPDGSITGVDPAFSVRIAKILKGGELTIDDSGKSLRPGAGVLMGANDNAKRFTVTAPVGKILLTDRPEFRWNSVKDADSYEVNIFDSNFNPVAASGSVKTNRWVIPKSLKRGGVYQWQVTANVGGEQIKSPVLPASPAKFKILDSAKAAEIDRASKAHPDQHLTLGVIYAEAGLIDDAIKEFERVARSNPDSELPRKFLKKLRSVR